MTFFYRFTKNNIANEADPNQPLLQYDDTHLTVPSIALFNINDLHASLDNNIQLLANKLEIWSGQGSGWTLSQIKGAYLNLYRFVYNNLCVFMRMF